MGYGYAQDLRDQVNEGLCSLEQAVMIHLRSNCYPPMPPALLPACMEALQHMESNEPDMRVQLPDGIQLVSRDMGFEYTDLPRAARVVEACRLEAFIVRKPPVARRHRRRNPRAR